MWLKKFCLLTKKNGSTPPCLRLLFFSSWTEVSLPFLSCRKSSYDPIWLIFISLTIHILLTKREGRTGRISARGLHSTDRVQRRVITCPSRVLPVFSLSFWRCWYWDWRQRSLNICKDENNCFNQILSLDWYSQWCILVLNSYLTQLPVHLISSNRLPIAWNWRSIGMQMCGLGIGCK